MQSTVRLGKVDQKGTIITRAGRTHQSFINGKGGMH